MGGSNGRPVIRREPRPWVRKLQAQRTIDHDPVREADQVQDVDDEPQCPGEEPALSPERAEPRDVRDARQPADHRDIALVGIAERRCSPPRRDGAGSSGQRGGRSGSPPGQRPGTGLSRFHGMIAASPTAKISGWPGRLRSEPTSRRPSRSVGRPRRLGHRAHERRRLDPGRPQRPSGSGSARFDPRPATVTELLVDGDDAPPRPDRSPEPLELAPGRRRAVLRVGRQDPIHRLHQEDPGARGVDGAEVAAEGVAGDLPEGAGQLHAGRAAADDDERHPLAPALGVGLALGGLEGDEDPAPDVRRVVERLQAGRRRAPTRRDRSTSGGLRRRRSACRTGSGRRPRGGPRAAPGRSRRPRRAARSCSVGGAGSSGAAGRCRPGDSAPVATW